MAQVSQGGAASTPRTFGEGYVFGVPVGGLGLFVSVIMSIAVGLAAFFAATFVAIFALLFYNSAAHHAIDFNVTYWYVGLPVGAVVMAFALVYMVRLWVRDLMRKS